MDRIRFAVVGAGGFARFAVQEFVKVPGVELAGVYDEDAGNAQLLSQATGKTMPQYHSLDALLANEEIDLVYIATPPYLHYPQSKAALEAGKHVICEKPASLRTTEAEALRQMAKDKDLLYVVNLMQRYNPLYNAVTQLIRSKALGEFLHGFFENYASDEFLGPDHWFWDQQKSGGIFIEHAVHFFDMFEGWLGKGEVIAAQQLYRPGHPGVCDRVQAIVKYNDALVNFYHGFDQPKAMDRQEMRLLFERGEITLYEWVPTLLKLNALCDVTAVDQLNTIFAGENIQAIEALDEPKTVKGRFKDITYQYKVQVIAGEDVKKKSRYQFLVTSMFVDQVAWIRDRSHQRVIDADNAVESVRMAVEAATFNP